MKLQVPRVPFPFSSDGSQLEVVVESAERPCDGFGPSDPFWPRVLGYQAFIAKDSGHGTRIQIVGLGIVHPTEREAVDALREGVDADDAHPCAPSDLCGRALESLARATRDRSDSKRQG